MQWNCPHCGIYLSLPDDKIKSGWSFARCYQCAGHALVRKPEINLMKVDKAPPGEEVLLPESPQSATHQQLAGQVLNRIRSEKAIGISPPRTTPTQTPNSSNTHPFSSTAFGGPWPETRSTEKRSAGLSRIGISAVIALCMTTAVYLVLKDDSPSTQNGAMNPATVAVTDQVKYSAMAPVNDPPPVSTLAPTSEPPTEAVETVPLVETPKATRPSMKVKVKGTNALLRSGPGMEYSVLSVALPNEVWNVIDWNDRWFKVSSSHTSNGQNSNETKREGWLRNDLLQVLSALDRPTSP